MKVLFSLAMVAAMGVCGAVCGAQQSEKQPVLTVKAQSAEVLLPVTVRDKKGQIVAGLKAEDFELLEDGKPAAIKSLTTVGGQPMRLGLLVDTSRSQAAALAGEKTAGEKFVDQMLTQPTDKAFLLHFDKQVELLQDFTGQKEKLHRELDAMESAVGGYGKGGDRPEVEAAGGRDGDEGGERRQGHRGGTQMYDAIYLASSEVMAQQPGRKAMVLFSDGVDKGSRESMADAVDAAEKANVSVYTVYFKGEQEGRGFQRATVGQDYPGGGYPRQRYPGGWPDGRRPTVGGDEKPVDGKRVMEKIAERTGGRFLEAKKKESFEEVCAEISEELRGQYLVSFVPAKASDDGGDGFHKVTLKAKNPDYTVFTREGYFDSGR